MNHPRLTVSLAGVAAMVSLAVGGVSRAEEANCRAESKQTAKAINADPESILKVVAERIAAAPNCACEIVKSAITASKADKDLVLQIVTAASESAPGEVPNIINCAIQTSPESATLIATRFSSETAGAGKAVVPSGKDTVATGKGKVPVEPTTEDDFSWDFGLMQPGVGGIYLVTPGAGVGYAPGQPRHGDKDGDGIPDAYDPNPTKPNDPNVNTGGGGKPPKPVRPPEPPPVTQSTGA